VPSGAGPSAIVSPLASSKLADGSEETAALGGDILAMLVSWGEPKGPAAAVRGPWRPAGLEDS
jgi:hypothetical protein